MGRAYQCLPVFRLKVEAKILIDGEETASFILDQKTFKTGSRGFHAQGKVNIADKRHQANVLLVEIGSGPKKEERKA
jgi:hypothetical protein